jgi:SPX domain protein involved in polyphosphate accumulation/uncharacterized membrane protein YidH (DUF202 family)
MKASRARLHCRRAAPRRAVAAHPPPSLRPPPLSLQFGKYLDGNTRPQWRPYYIDYAALKDLIKECERGAAREAELGTSLRETSLTVARAAGRADSAEERFFRRLEAEVAKVGAFTAELVAQLRARLARLQERAAAVEAARTAAAEAAAAAAPDAAGSSSAGSAPPPPPPPPTAAAAAALAEAKAVGDEFLALEKYVNLNYMGLHKVLKKHDKRLPHAPCRQFYVAHLHGQPWVQGNYSDLVVQLSAAFSRLRGDRLAEAAGGAAQAFNRSTTKHWVAVDDVSAVKRTIIENMPVFVFEGSNYAGDAQLVNSVYLDNDLLELYHGRLDKRPGALAVRVRWYGPGEPRTCFVERKTHRESWKGERSVKERFALPADRVLPFLEGEYSAAEYAADLRARGRGADDVAKASALFEEVQRQVEAKQLKPLVRTQYMRSAFQMGHDRSVSFTLDTNLVMLKENPEGRPSCALAGRWYRDPSAPVARTEITRFPHAVLEVKLALPEGTPPPAWVAELTGGGLLTEVHKMSKFVHGTAVLFPELVQAVPYWVDDESVRASIEASAPTPPGAAAAGAPDAAAAARAKPRRRVDDEAAAPAPPAEHHPLLGDAPALALMRGARGSGGLGPGPAAGPAAPWWNPFAARAGPAEWTPQRLEPKTFLASERTFLSWLHMAVTLGAIAAALLAFAATAARPRSPARAASRGLVEFIALLLLPLACLVAAYAVVVFLWRNAQIARREAAYIDDRRGPLLLAGAVTAALSAIFVAACLDLLDQCSDAGRLPPAPPAAPPAHLFAAAS